MSSSPSSGSNENPNSAGSSNLLLFIALGAAVVALGGFVGWKYWGGAPASGLPRVKVAINTWPGLGPYYVARAKGYDKEFGVDLDVVMIEDTVARNTALVSGDADLVGITLDNVIISQARGLPMVVVAESDFSNGGDGIIATTDIKTVADLKGKKVACAEGLPSHFFLLYLLRQAKLGPKDITLIPADDGGQAALVFTGKKADAAVTWDPWISQAQEKLKDAGHVIVTTREHPGLILGIVAANKNKLADRADRITQAQKAWFKAVQFCKDHPEEANAIMAKEYNVPVKEFGPMIAGAKLADLEETKKTFGTKSEPGPIYQLAKDADALWLEAGAIKKAVPAESVIDRTIVDKLLEGK
jgi:NitT/TauT family transport system substrate-binding protein